VNAKVKASASGNVSVKGSDNYNDNDMDNDNDKGRGKDKDKDVHAARHIEDGTGACLAGSRMLIARSGWVRGEFSPDGGG
jgi:hypothetical protein